MDGNYGINLEAVFHHIKSAETFSIFFPRLGKALVVDMRHTAQDPPMIPWGAYVDSMVTSGMWKKVSDRIAEAESEKADKNAEEALHELLQAERRELKSLIEGDQYETIWARQG